VEYISYETYPEMPLITAIKMTSAVPILFPFVEYNNKKYVDGGLLENFPISIFHDQLDKVIGINIMAELPSKHSNIIEYILLILGIVYFNGFNKYENQIYKNSVFNLILNDNNTFNFELTPEKKKEMYYEGYSNIKKNFNLL
jgi:NTE family protein